MMVGIGEETLKGSNGTQEIKISVKKDKNEFQKPYTFTVLSSLPSKPDDIKMNQINCTNSNEIDDMFDKEKGLKMMFVNGKLLRTNIHLLDNEFEYYRLIGEAYNAHVLDRSLVESTKLVQKNEKGKPNVYLTYVINDIPQTMAQNTKYDAKYGYSKQVLVQSGNNKQKLYSTTCNKLKYNTINKRLNECRLASGYFIVNQCGLFKKPYKQSKNLADFGVQFNKV